MVEAAPSSNRRSNRGRPVSIRLLGRAQELELIRSLLVDGTRLLTLVGPGGVGKTREVLARYTDAFRDGIWFVDLSALSDPSLVLGTIAASLGLTAAGRDPLVEQLSAYLQKRDILLILDNVEQESAASLVRNTVVGLWSAKFVSHASSMVRSGWAAINRMAISDAPAAISRLGEASRRTLKDRRTTTTRQRDVSETT